MPTDASDSEAAVALSPPRDTHEAPLDEFTSFLDKVARDHQVDFSDVVGAKLALEAQRANDIAVDDGDIKDEQLAGFGKLLEEHIAAHHG